MAIRCANQPLEHLKLHKIIAIFQRLAGPHQKAMIRAMPGLHLIHISPMKVNRMSDTYPPVASEVKPFAQHSNACQNVRPLTRTFPALMISASGTFNPSSFASSRQ